MKLPNNLLDFLHRKGWMQVSKHEEAIRYKNKTIQSAVHQLIESERTIDALTHSLAAKLTGLDE